jgi:hypothetical protein
VATVTYPVSVAYCAVPNMRGVQPAAEVVLYNGGLETKAVAVFDSGSPYTVFSSEHAQLIGIDDVTLGVPERISTLGGGLFEIYLFGLELQLVAVGPRFAGQIGFFSTRAPRNILGRSVVFAAFEIGFHERAQRLHLRAQV